MDSLSLALTAFEKLDISKINSKVRGEQEPEKSLFRS